MIKKRLCFFLGVLLFAETVFASPRDPFSAIPATTACAALANYTLAQLSMVGTIRAGNQLWAIVRAPNQHVYPINVGTLIGHSRVIQITPQQITAQQMTDNAQLQHPPHIDTVWLTQVQ